MKAGGILHFLPAAPEAPPAPPAPLLLVVGVPGLLAPAAGAWLPIPKKRAMRLLCLLTEEGAEGPLLWLLLCIPLLLFTGADLLRAEAPPAPAPAADWLLEKP